MSETREHLVASAARNNADWCDLFCRLRGVDGRFHVDAWACPTRTPALYPDAVTLRRSVDPAELLARVDASVGCSIKDSFADLDLAPWGFATLFEASWIHRPREAPGGASGTLELEPVRDASALAAWEAAWGEGAGGPGAFPPALLEREDVVVLAARRAHTVVSGAILSLGGGAVGLSNLFATDPDLAGAFASASAAAARLFPRLPLVGYESGAALEAAEQAGFERVGRLVVWVKGSEGSRSPEA